MGHEQPLPRRWNAVERGQLVEVRDLDDRDRRLRQEGETVSPGPGLVCDMPTGAVRFGQPVGGGAATGDASCASTAASAGTPLPVSPQAPTTMARAPRKRSFPGWPDRSFVITKSVRDRMIAMGPIRAELRETLLR